MTRINLDKHFQPFGAGIEFDEFLFPSNCEVHIKLKGYVDEKVLITHRIRSSNDLILLLLATDAVRRTGATEISVFISYLPYARQDRVMVPGEPLSLRVLADILNAQNYGSVSFYDVHSDVATAVMDRSFSFSNHRFVGKVLSDKKDYCIISPDAGASKKIYKLAQEIGYTGEIIECTKTRDVSTGAITGVQVHWTDLCGLDCYIIDDICDGGGTFTLLAQELKRNNAGYVNLAVSHAILSKGPEALLNHGINHIYCTDSYDSLNGRWKPQIMERITQYKLADGLLS